MCHQIRNTQAAICNMTSFIFLILTCFTNQNLKMLYFGSMVGSVRDLYESKSYLYFVSDSYL